MSRTRPVPIFDVLVIGCLLSVSTSVFSAEHEPGLGSLLIDGAAHGFDVTMCNPMGEPGSIVAGGRATDARGDLLLNVDIMAMESPQKTTHMVTVMFKGGRQLVANYVKEGGMWKSFDKPVAGPLIRVDGSQLVIKGVFHNQAAETEHGATIELTCPVRE